MPAAGSVATVGPASLPVPDVGTDGLGAAFVVDRAAGLAELDAVGRLGEEAGGFAVGVDGLAFDVEDVLLVGLLLECVLLGCVLLGWVVAVVGAGDVVVARVVLGLVEGVVGAVDGAVVDGAVVDGAVVDGADGAGALSVAGDDSPAAGRAGADALAGDVDVVTDAESVGWDDADMTAVEL